MIRRAARSQVDRPFFPSRRRRSSALSGGLHCNTIGLKLTFATSSTPTALDAIWRRVFVFAGRGERLLGIRVGRQLARLQKKQPSHQGGGKGPNEGAGLPLAQDRRPLLDEAHAVIRRRCWLSFGALWNLPSFIMARMRDLSCRIRTSAIGSPSTNKRSAR
jgi:hypothetical protein